MLHRAVQVRLYPSAEQEILLAQTFGCSRWWWNYALNKSNVTITDNNIKLPGHIGIVKAKIHRPIDVKIKTVTVSKTPSGKYLASILTEVEGKKFTVSKGKIYGVDLGIKHFAVVTDGIKTSKYDHPRHLAKHEKNLKRKQKKLARKQKGSKSRQKYRRIVAKVYERISNSRQDFLHKISHKLVSDSLVVIVENLHGHCAWFVITN
jgi:putative transposase